MKKHGALRAPGISFHCKTTTRQFFHQGRAGHFVSQTADQIGNPGHNKTTTRGQQTNNHTTTKKTKQQNTNKQQQNNDKKKQE